MKNTKHKIQYQKKNDSLIIPHQIIFGLILYCHHYNIVEEPLNNFLMIFKKLLMRKEIIKENFFVKYNPDKTVRKVQIILSITILFAIVLCCFFYANESIELESIHQK